MQQGSAHSIQHAQRTVCVTGIVAITTDSDFCMHSTRYAEHSGSPGGAVHAHGTQHTWLFTCSPPHTKRVAPSKQHCGALDKRRLVRPHSCFSCETCARHDASVLTEGTGCKPAQSVAALTLTERTSAAQEHRVHGRRLPSNRRDGAKLHRKLHCTKVVQQACPLLPWTGAT